MTPEDHRDEAHRLIEAAQAITSNYDETNPAAMLILAEAQVHATLALNRPVGQESRA